MLKFSHRTLIALSGLLWLAVGVYLISLGSYLILGSFSDPSTSQNKAFIIIVSALFVGHLKGRFVLKKAVLKQISRILSFPNPSPITHIYSLKYYLLLGFMMGLGIAMRVLPIATSVRGAIDLTIGSALTNGALLYFRYATTSYKVSVQEVSRLEESSCCDRSGSLRRVNSQKAIDEEQNNGDGAAGRDKETSKPLERIPNNLKKEKKIT